MGWREDSLFGDVEASSYYVAKNAKVNAPILKQDMMDRRAHYRHPGPGLDTNMLSGKVRGP